MRVKASLALAVFLACACISTTPDVADAARLGGGRSFGSQPAMRQSAPAPMQRPQAMQPQQRQMQQNAAPQKPGGLLGGLGGMGGILGGVLAGTLLGSLLSGGGLGGGGGFLDIILLGLVAFLAYKFFSRRRAATPAPAAPGGMAAAPQVSPYQPVEREDIQQPAAGDAWGNLRSQPASGMTAEVPSGPALPEGFDAEEFLRGAKMAYTRLQKSWDARDLNDIAQFANPAVMEAVREQLKAEPTPTTTELLLVNAQLLEVTREPDGVERAQVYFDVLMREDPRQETPSSVREIWHFMREGAQGMWRLDGIQQVA